MSRPSSQAILRSELARDEARVGFLRQAGEALVSLCLAVILLRSFATEGYMIATGSMAPCLLGYHRRVVCPSCQFAFSRGTRFDAEATLVADSSSIETPLLQETTACPNCGLSTIDISEVPRTEGDQLMVLKHFYQLRPPKRWEVVVFRHPDDPEQPYVKRVVGLPGETVEIVDGDVYADGAICRKSLTTQRAMRIVVHDLDQPLGDRSWQIAAGTGWTRRHDGFYFQVAPDRDIAEGFRWLSHRHWLAAGGSHRSSVELKTWPANLAPAATLDSRLDYDPQGGLLSYEGVMDHEDAQRLQLLKGDDRSCGEWTSAISALAVASHLGPIVDRYDYNLPPPPSEMHPVHDLMLEAVVESMTGEGRWALRLHDGWHVFDLVIDGKKSRADLIVDGAAEPICSIRLPAKAFRKPTRWEFSVFDRQVLVALDGELLWEPWPYPAASRSRSQAPSPVQVGAAGVELHLSRLTLYRDVHYTQKVSPDGQERRTMGPEEFYVLGDNSPVSVDSRSWESPAIPRRMLVGKPFLVHLPSRRGQLSWSGAVRDFRIPDFSRVRYIR